VGFIEVLSDRCHFSDLVWFSVTKPLLCFSSLHKVPQVCRQRCYRMPSLALVIQITDHLQIQRNKSTTFTVRRWWRYCPARHPYVHILSRIYLVKECNDVAVCRVLRCVRTWWYASHTKHCTVWVVAARMCLYLWLETQWKQATRWNILCQKTIHEKYITADFTN
jgi:hypothetical protein